MLLEKKTVVITGAGGGLAKVSRASAIAKARI